MQLEQKQKFTKNRGCLPKCKKVFFWYVYFLLFGGFVFVACVLVLCFVKKASKRLVSCNFRGFVSILFPQKACLKVFLFFLFCFFCFCLPFQNSILSLCFLAISPFLENINIFGFFLFLFLVFPFLMFACFFQTNFPNIPFLKSNLLSFLAVSFFLLFLFLFWLCVCFSLSVFLLLCWLCFWCFFGFCFVFCFCLLSCFGSSLWKKKAVFPAILVFFWVLLVKRVVWFYVLCFCSCLFVLCCFFPF